jgi:hypothetical protein
MRNVIDEYVNEVLKRTGLILTLFKYTDTVTKWWDLSKTNDYFLSAPLVCFRC